MLSLIFHINSFNHDFLQKLYIHNDKKLGMDCKGKFWVCDNDFRGLGVGPLLYCYRSDWVRSHAGIASQIVSFNNETK
jgi:hypothetical protein